MVEDPSGELGAVRICGIKGTSQLHRLLLLQQAGSGLVKQACVEVTCPLGSNEGEGNCFFRNRGKGGVPASPGLPAAQSHHWEWSCGTDGRSCVDAAVCANAYWSSRETPRETEEPGTQLEQHCERVLRKSERMPGAKH